MKTIKKIQWLLSLPRRVAALRDRIEHLQPIGLPGEIQRIFDINYTPKSNESH